MWSISRKSQNTSIKYYHNPIVSQSSERQKDKLTNGQVKEECFIEMNIQKHLSAIQYSRM